MKLSKQSKDELRSKIEEQLSHVPKGMRIHLDKNILEYLLFEVITIDKEKGIIVKLPVWSGEFLSRIDLSDVDFTDVSWGMLDPNYNFNNMIATSEIAITNDVCNKIRNISKTLDKKSREDNREFIIVYVGTNANIDLTKSFEARYGKHINIRYCNFSGHDFSHLDLTSMDDLVLQCSSINRTKLRVPNKVSLYAIKSGFEGIDLSNRKIDFMRYLSSNGDNLSDCNLRNTGINIDIYDISMLKKHTYRSGLYVLRDALKSKLVGCIFDGKITVHSSEEKAKIAQQKKEEYEKMKKDYFDSIQNPISEQISKMKR